MPRRSRGRLTEYHLRVEMRRLADAVFEHAQTEPEDAMGCYKEARLLVRLAIEASRDAVQKSAMTGTVKALESYQDKLRKQVEARKTLKNVTPEEAETGGPH